MTQTLVRQVLPERAECFSYHETYRVMIFANLGTTFAGGQDSLTEIGERLAEIEAIPSYIHVDRAMDLGFLVEGTRLGPPNSTSTGEGIPIVQGITLSHHKALCLYCLENASFLRKLLNKVNVPTRFKEKRIITLLERPPPWLVEEFQLALKVTGSISFPCRTFRPRQPSASARAMALIDTNCATAFDYVGNLPTPLYAAV
ncbi:hypothetical protein BDW75DRAFT_242355 [Aspergillus navahoensis]